MNSKTEVLLNTCGFCSITPRNTFSSLVLIWRNKRSLRLFLPHVLLLYMGWIDVETRHLRPQELSQLNEVGVSPLDGELLAVDFKCDLVDQVVLDHGLHLVTPLDFDVGKPVFDVVLEEIDVLVVDSRLVVLLLKQASKEIGYPLDCLLCIGEVGVLVRLILRLVILLRLFHRFISDGPGL